MSARVYRVHTIDGQSYTATSLTWDYAVDRPMLYMDGASIAGVPADKVRSIQRPDD